MLASHSDCRHWGLLEIFTHYGAIRAAHKLLTPLLKPVLGLPGRSGLALITDLQSTGAGLINNYFAIGSALFVSLSIPVLIPLIAIHNLLPNVVMAYVIAEMLNLTGLWALLVRCLHRTVTIHGDPVPRVGPRGTREAHSEASSHPVRCRAGGDDHRRVGAGRHGRDGAGGDGTRRTPADLRRTQAVAPIPARPATPTTSRASATSRAPERVRPPPRCGSPTTTATGSGRSTPERRLQEPARRRHGGNSTSRTTSDQLHRLTCGDHGRPDLPRSHGGTTIDTAALECLSRTDDFESVVYDPNADVLYVTSGNCCNGGLPPVYSTGTTRPLPA